MKRAPRVVCRGEELVVAGTADPMEAVRVVLHDRDVSWFDVLTPLDFPTVHEVKTQLNTWVATARTGWRRTLPGCPGRCGEGHTTHVIDAAPGSRGAFPVVWWDRCGAC